MSKPIFLTIGLTALLMGCSPYPYVPNSTNPVQQARSQERLGTTWGDEVDSRVTRVDLRRTSSQSMDELQVYYADKNYAGRRINSVSLLGGKVDFSATSDRTSLPMYRDGSNYYLKGQAGQAYRLQYHNNSNNTYEIVASVDGLDVISGDRASPYSGGYVLKPYDDLTIEGFRKNQNSVASFIFSQPNDAYASNTSAGSINNTGVIGTVIYELYDPTKPQNTNPQAFPANNTNQGHRYAQPPH